MVDCPGPVPTFKMKGRPKPGGFHGLEVFGDAFFEKSESTQNQ